MKKFFLGLLVLGSVTSYASDNCKIKAMPGDSRDGILYSLVAHKSEVKVKSLSECVDEAKRVLESEYDRTDTSGVIDYYGSPGNYRKVKFNYEGQGYETSGEVTHQKQR